MTHAPKLNDRHQIELRRKKRVQIMVRLVGWVTFICYAFGNIGAWLYGRGLTHFDESLMTLAAVLLGVYALIVIHVLLGVRSLHDRRTTNKNKMAEIHWGKAQA
jgi:hypothetical protein